jgi:PTH1 family peptidyl-tRNA hydrolase
VRLRPAKRADAEGVRTGTPADLLVVGLGNPGKEYQGTRHNVGVEVLDVLARRHGGTFRRAKELALVAEVRIEGKRVALAFPQTYMNESGQSVRLLCRRHGVEDPTRLVIVHDEIDFPAGRLQVKRGGGLAGHNGLRSIKAHLHTDAFLRLRIGVGKPPRPGPDWVLSKPSKADREVIDVIVERAADAVEKILLEGVDAAMQVYNRDDG